MILRATASKTVNKVSLLRKPSNILMTMLSVVLGFSASSAQASWPLPPRASMSAYPSNNYTVGEADIMLPIQGDSTHNLYIDPDLAYASNNQGFADVGLGYRWLANPFTLYGAYLFGGYSRIANDAHVLVINPGIEALGSRWDAHFNVYLPMGDRHTNLGTVSTISNFLFTGNTQQSIFMQTQYQQRIGDGADIKFGYQLFSGVPLKGYLGSYFFAPGDTPNIWGGAAGLEYWLDETLKLFSGYTYDPVNHSTIALGLGVEFGGMRQHRSNPDVSERITDPVERNLAALGQGTGIPARTRTVTQPPQLVTTLTNIAFFSQTGSGTLASLCTFENPCSPTLFTNATLTSLNKVLPKTTIYVNGGTYTAGSDIAPLNLKDGQSLHSRTADYTAEANAADRTQFNGFFNLASNTTLDAVVINNTPTINNIVSVNAQNASNILIKDSVVNLNYSAATGLSLTAFAANDIKNLQISNTQFNATIVATAPIGAAIVVLNGSGANFSTAVLNNVTVNNSVANASAGTNLSSFAMSGTAIATINNSTINLLVTGVAAPSAIGLTSNISAATNLNNVIINVSDLTSPGAYGLRNGGTGAITMKGQSITVTGNAIKNGAGPFNITNTVCTLNGAASPC